jgi:hypothetical protein
MAEDASAFVIPFHQVPPEAKARTGAKRAKTSRKRKPQKAKTVVSEAAAASEAAVIPEDAESRSSGPLIPADYLSKDWIITEPAVTQPPTVASEVGEPATPSRRPVVAILLSVAALALAAAGITMNGWFARSLGSSDVASWLFLAIGVAADLVALAMPSRAAGLWRGGHRTTALVGWSLWLMTFAFAVTAGIGFASTNIADVTLARASRLTPAVATAQSALGDAMAARDRECKGGVGKFCREREAAVADRRQILDVAMTSVGQTADPQTDAAIKVVTWVSRGLLRPAPEDFIMLRLVLLALLPQMGGMLLMIGRRVN